MRRSPFATIRSLALPAVALLIGAPLLGACSLFNHGKLVEEPPAHREPSTTSIYGDWVLATPSDSTAFAGASLVELNVEKSAFTITATYPRSTPTVIRGTLATTDGALLTLTPTTGTRGRGAMALIAGQPVTVLASAAGNTMVFSAPGGVTASDPSSVWHRKEAAKAAGTLPAKTP